MPKTTYTTAEKEHALRRCAEIGVQRASEELGINMNSLYAWRRKMGPDDKLSIADTGAAIPAEDAAVAEKTPRTNRKIATTNEPANEELIRLRTENAALQAQVVSLKKALRAFAD